jgi:hypothetical protein
MDIHETNLNNKSRLLEAADVLQHMGEAFSELVRGEDDDSRSAVTAQIQMTIACCYVKELANHLNDGMEFYDALRATARGELKINPKAAAAIERIERRHNDPMSKN